MIPPTPPSPTHNAPVPHGPPTADPTPRANLYEDFNRELYAAVVTESVPARVALFDHFNQVLVPPLVDDMSYFEMLLAKMAQIHFSFGQPIRAMIQQERSGAPTSRWATDNVMTNIVASRQRPGFSFMLQPADPQSEKAHALCFPGTGPAYKRDILCKRDYPRGVRDDLHWRGVGYEGFKVNRDTWLGQARPVLEQGRELWLVGHSLGAAYASQMMGYLHKKLPQHEGQVHLISIYPPGLRRKTLKALVPLHSRIHRKRHRFDVTGWCGAGHPGGTLYTSSDWVGSSLIPFQVPHAVPQGAIRLLRGEEPQAHVQVVGMQYHWLPIAEAVRLGANVLLWRRLGY